LVSGVAYANYGVMINNKLYFNHRSLLFMKEFNAFECANCT
jgi:hypothetical protein